MDVVGFGQHSHLTYKEVMKEQPQYVDWAIDTAQESECDYRLSRLATWAMEQRTVTAAETPVVTTPRPRAPTVRGTSLSSASGSASFAMVDVQDVDEEIAAAENRLQELRRQAQQGKSRRS